MLVLWVSSNIDGTTVCPSVLKPYGPSQDAKRRVYFTGKLTDLSPLQLGALVELAYRDAAVWKGHRKAVFYDCLDVWTSRPKPLLTYMMRAHG